MSSRTRAVIRKMRRDDQGSMLFALLGVLLVSGLVVGILATVLIGQRAIRHDQRFDASGQSSDAGVQQAYFAINSLPSDSTVTSLNSGGPVTIDDSTYTWTASRPSSDSLTWTVDSTADAVSAGETTSRTVSAEVRQNSIFNMAAFADSSINFGGNNAATSYPTAGFGQIGTNGTISMNGSSTTVDSITFYDWDTNPDPDRCDGHACSATTTTDGSRLDVGSSLGTDGFIQAQIDECKAAGPLTSFVGSTIAARAQPYCFTSFFADTQNFTVTGTGTARIFVEGGDVVLGNKNHSDVNYDIPLAPSSIKLQIYTTGNTVSVWNQGNIAAAIYAPNAACGGVSSNAATNFYGSMICKTIDNVGGWTFHFDMRLASVGDGVWRVKNYAEPLE